MNDGPPAQQRLACIGDASRFRLVVALAAGERCVTDLAGAVGLSQSCTTRHLQTLQAAGLVHRIRYGKRVMVGLRRDEPELRPLFDWVLALAERGETPPPRPDRTPRRATPTPPRNTPRAAARGESDAAGRSASRAARRLARPARVPTPAPSPEMPARFRPSTAVEPAMVSETAAPDSGVPRRRPEPLEDFLL